ncbi:MAG: isoprenylcysteine carboxylmethyltransferase family protein [Burkholderiales bacterium]|nr:isoprenylcysteine carboxylmethyltransferase family protein [Burkholderiales bacterium]
MNEFSDYGLWSLVAINSLIFIVFAFSFTRPKSPRDWRSFGAFSAFLVALFTEMYGFPLTIYLFSGWLSSRFPEVDWFAHDSGHLLEMLFGWGGDPHAGPFHLLSAVFVFGGFILLAWAWRVLYRAQRTKTLARSGPYAMVRHPQYTAFISIMFGFLLQWPTLLTLLMFPILVYMYLRLAQREEREAFADFGDEYRSYLHRTPAFFPGIRHTLRLSAAVLLAFLVPAAIVCFFVPDEIPAAHMPLPGEGAKRVEDDVSALRQDLIQAHLDELHRIGSQR